MKPKMKIKMTIDLLMSVLLLCLMAYQIVGEVLHEWFGAGMLALFILHTVLNLNWYGNLFKGKYTALRMIGTVLNFAVLAAILCLGYSGVVMSRHLFAFLPITSGMALARVMHLMASYWGFVLMSLHLGLHWGMITGMAKKAFRITGSNRAAGIASKIAVLGVSAYGVYAFITERIADNLFLRTQFVFFDYEASASAVFGKYIAMMALFMAAGYYGAKLLKRTRKKTKEADGE